MRAHAGHAGDRGYRADGPRRTRSTMGARVGASDALGTGVAAGEAPRTGVGASEATGTGVGTSEATGTGVGQVLTGCSDR